MPLEVYASHAGFLDIWRVKSMDRFAFVVVVWIVLVLGRVARLRYGCIDAVSASLFAYTFVSSLVAVLAYCQLHICCGLELIVDSFCGEVAEVRDTCGDVSLGIKEWNVIQAMLRRAAFTIDACFLLLNTALLGTLMITGLEVMEESSNPMQQGSVCTGLWLGAEIPYVALALCLVFRAAAVTEKCSRVPALINSWSFNGEDESKMDHNRQYVVQYITNSAAGFYVMGVRLTAFQALKLTYVAGLVLVTLVSQSVQRA